MGVQKKKIGKSEDYFGITDNELLQDDDRGCTHEENLLVKEGKSVTYFDDVAEYEEEKMGLFAWATEKGYSCEAVIETVNHRIAVVFV